MKIVLCATKNMYPQLFASINMLIASQPRLQHIYAFIETDFEDNKNYPIDKVTFINIKNYPQVISPKINSENNWTYMCFARCYLTSILDEDKVIYLDLDTIVFGDLFELWNIDIENYSVAGVTDLGIFSEMNIGRTPYISDREHYINSGVLLMNLKFIRERGIDTVMDALLTYQKLAFPDQDCINLACHDSIKLIDSKWNYSVISEKTDNPVIIHDLAVKPWNPLSTLFKLWCSYYFNKQI